MLGWDNKSGEEQLVLEALSMYVDLAIKKCLFKLI